MRFEINKLSRKSLHELRTIFSSIPKSETMIELIGDFKKTGLFESSLAATALSYLPKHVNAVKFGGTYVYDRHEETVDSGSNPRGYETTYYYTAKMGGLLNSFISSLPKSINSLLLSFQPSAYHPVRYSNIIPNLGFILKNIPDSITQLDFSGAEIYGLDTIIHHIPKTVSVVHLSGLSASFQHLLTRRAIFLSMSQSVTRLSLSGNDLYRNPSLIFFDGMRDNIVSLDLGNNGFNQLNRVGLHTVFSSVPNTLSSLSLRKNNLSNIVCHDLAYALSALPIAIIQIDLGENGILLMGIDELKTILSGLSSTIQSLRLCETNIQGMSVAELSIRFVFIPSHIDTLSFSDSNLFGLSVSEFADTLSNLPDTITTLDLGGNDLCNRSALELHYLFSKIPVNVMTLKLQRNNLSSLNEATLKQAFSALHNNMRDLDLSDNGFDRLFHTNLNQLLSAAPDILLRIGDRGSLSIRNDGALIPSLPAVFYGIFKPLRHVRHHQQFAELRLVMWQLIQSKNINLDLTGVIFSFLLPPSLRDIGYMLHKLATRIIPSRPPAIITKLEQQECMEAAHFRINSLNPHSTRLDLSRCGLNRLSAAMLRDVFQTIPVTATGISFRGNGFQHLEQGMQAFLEVIKEIPDHITYLDLSENGFEFDHDALSRTKQLLTNLPATVQYVSLAHEQPLSAAKHLARIDWSNRYLPLKLLRPTQTPMQQARILLDDYTQGDSVFFRVIKGRWNSPCADEVAKIVQCIDHDLISSTIDLSAELEQIPVQNYGESLSSRISFISQIATKTSPVQIDAFESGNNSL